MTKPVAVPLLDLKAQYAALRDEIRPAVDRVLESQQCINGPEVAQLAKEVARYCQARHCVGVSSGTDAILLSLMALDVGAGDEVVTTPYTFFATAGCIARVGAKAVFVDIDPATFNIDPARIEAAITPRTKAIMPVHQMGLPADMDRFLELAERHGLVVVEDAACAIGALHRGRPIGSLGPLACFSFHPRKVITCGEGGMIAVHDAELAERLRRLRQHAMDQSALARHAARDVVIEHYPERGWNARMTDLQAAVGLRQLEVLDTVLAERRRLAERYSSLLSPIPSILVPHEPDYAVRTWQSYPIRLGAGAPVGAEELMRQLMADGIATRRGIMAIHLEGAYAEDAVELPHTEAAARDVVLLPLFPGLTEEAQDHVISRLGHYGLAEAA
jgi:perosamine synthetase